MWSLQNRTAFAADRTWVRDIDGHHQWVVAVKATYRIDEAGALALAEHQPPPLHLPQHYGAPESSSVQFSADLGAPKPGTDILVNACAHAPAGKPATEVPVTLRAAGRTKTLVVFGERTYVGRSGFMTSGPTPYVSCPIRYELAYGGQDLADPEPSRNRLDTRNPVGRGVSTQSLRGRPAHRIEYPGKNPAKAGPAGFGAVASHWSPRRELAGTYDDRWAQTKRPLLPDDYSSLCMLASPQDQRPTGGRLHGGERIELLNMTPSGWLSLELPRCELALETRFGRRRVHHPGHLTTVHVDAQNLLLMLVWQSSVAVPASEVDALDFTTIEARHG
jgi:hypothetical protein